MYAGYMDGINGVPGLARIIPQIIRDWPDICFLFIGFGPEEDRLKALAKEYPRNVKFLPWVPYLEMPAYYQLCDVFVVPRPSTISAETATPLKLLDAMVMGKPVLGSNVDGIAEVITHGENGYLFQKGNLESLQRTLLEVLDADNTEISRGARKTIIENFSWDKSAKILQQVYEEVLWK
jgi:spore coat protein SA